jgi:hypothetical protein
VCAGKVKVGLGRDGQELSFFFRKNTEVFVHIFQPSGIFQLSFLFKDRLIFAFKQFFGGLTPSAKVVFVEDDEVPIHFVQPFVFGLDVACRVVAQQVLKGAKIDDRLLAVDLRWVRAG